MNHEQPPQEPEPEEQERDPSVGVEPRIWVGSLSDYNNGILHGEWLDAAREADDIQADIQAMLGRSPTAIRYREPAEEWGIFDYEGFGQLRLGEHESITWFSQVARGIKEHGLAYAAYADYIGPNPGEADSFEDVYLGHYDSAESYAEQLVDDLGYQQHIDELLPESLQPYIKIDIEQLARDMQPGGEIVVETADDGGVWIFRGH